MKKQTNIFKKFKLTPLPYFIAIIFLLAAVNLANASTLEGFCIGVKDGDTIKVRTVRGDLDIRLYGIDTPETQKRGKPGQPFGRQATNFTNKLVRKKHVVLDIVDTDRYGREIAIVHINNLILNKELVAHGYAWVYRKYCKANFCSDWLKLEAAARENKSGLWRDTNPINPAIWRKRK